MSVHGPSRATAMTYLTTGARAAITATTAAGNPIAPQPGFIGSDYRGVVFCALNPGEPKGGSQEEEYYDLYRDLGQESDRVQARRIFEAASQQFIRHMTEFNDGRRPWPMYERFIRKVLTGSGLQLKHVAYINVVPFPTLKDSQGLSDRLIREAVDRHTRTLIQDLEPKCVIFRYKKAFESLATEAHPARVFSVNGIAASNREIDEAITLVSALA